MLVHDPVHAVPAARPRDRDLEASAGHLLRLCLDLQLDALMLTLGALASDRAAESAAEAAGCGVLVSLGGDIAVAGAPPSNGWSIEIADHHSAPFGSGPRVSIRSGVSNM